MEGFTEVRVIEVFNRAPETVIRVSALSKETVDMGIPLKGAAKGVKNTDKTGNEVFGFIQGEKEFFNNIRNRFKKTVQQVAVFQEEMSQRCINGKDQMPVSTVNQFKGHSSRPVIRIFRPASRAKFGMAAKRDKFKVSAMGTAIHGTTIRGITAVDDLFNVFHDNRSWFYIVFNYFIIIPEHFLYHIHEIIMKQSRAESKPFPLKIEG